MTGSNRRPPACKAGALPAELIPQETALSWCTVVGRCRLTRRLQHLVGLGGLEPPTPALSRRCSNQLSYRPKPVTSRIGTPNVRPNVASDILPTTDKCGRLN